jgi:hypothetical protein
VSIALGFSMKEYALMNRLYGEVDWRSGSSDWKTKVQGVQDHR